MTVDDCERSPSGSVTFAQLLDVTPAAHFLLAHVDNEAREMLRDLFASISSMAAIVDADAEADSSGFLAEVAWALQVVDDWIAEHLPPGMKDGATLGDIRAPFQRLAVKLHGGGLRALGEGCDSPSGGCTFNGHVLYDGRDAAQSTAFSNVAPELGLNNIAPAWPGMNHHAQLKCVSFESAGAVVVDVDRRGLGARPMRARRAAGGCRRRRCRVARAISER